MYKLLISNQSANICMSMFNELVWMQRCIERSKMANMMFYDVFPCAFDKRATKKLFEKKCERNQWIVCVFKVGWSEVHLETFFFSPKQHVETMFDVAFLLISQKRKFKRTNRKRRSERDKYYYKLMQILRLCLPFVYRIQTMWYDRHDDDDVNKNPVKICCAHLQCAHSISMPNASVKNNNCKGYATWKQIS